VNDNPLRPLVKLTRVSTHSLEVLIEIVDVLGERDTDEVPLSLLEITPDRIHPLTTAGMLTLMYMDGVLEAPTHLKVTVLGMVTATAALALQQDAERQQASPVTVTRVKPKREYGVDGSNGKFLLREYVNSSEKHGGPVEKFPTRKQAEHVALLLNEALAW
jgi:hypothetical protein